MNAFRKKLVYINVIIVILALMDELLAMTVMCRRIPHPASLSLYHMQQFVHEGEFTNFVLVYGGCIVYDS